MAEVLKGIPENIIYTKERPGVWKGKDGSHVPVVTSVKEGEILKVTVENKHGMAEGHYIVRHVIVTEAGEVLGGKTFSWKDKPISTHEIKVEALAKTPNVFVTSYCSLHDLWLAQAKLAV